MGWHGSRYITAQHILDQSDDLVESDHFTENSSHKIWEALLDCTEIEELYVGMLLKTTSQYFSLEFILQNLVCGVVN